VGPEKSYLDSSVNLKRGGESSSFGTADSGWVAAVRGGDRAGTKHAGPGTSAAWQDETAVVSSASGTERQRRRAMMECARAWANRSRRPLRARIFVGLGRAGL